jgi:hypothetical protein
VLLLGQVLSHGIAAHPSISAKNPLQLQLPPTVPTPNPVITSTNESAKKGTIGIACCGNGNGNGGKNALTVTGVVSTIITATIGAIMNFIFPFIEMLPSLLCTGAGCFPAPMFLTAG